MRAFILVIAVLVLVARQASAQQDPAAGKAFALEVCTPCHVVAPDQLSPRRFAVAPDFNAIANTPANERNGAPCIPFRRAPHHAKSGPLA